MQNCKYGINKTKNYLTAVFLVSNADKKNIDNMQEAYNITYNKVK